MAVAATGFFDGVHRGHQSVIGTMAGLASQRSTEGIVITFWPHPRNVLQQDADRLRLLTSIEEKRELCIAAGADRVEVLPFTRDFSRVTAEGFIREYLVGRFGVTDLVLGSDHRLGCDCLSSTDEMAALVRSCGVEPHIVADELMPDGRGISSTAIRRTIASGDVRTASSLLGYRYPLTGVVVAGARIGRTIGFPTANMQLYEPLKLIPDGGVYLVEVDVLGSRHRGICNIGTRPTLSDGRGRTIETHILDFDEEIYGLDMTIRFVDKIRDERRFDSLDGLAAQLGADRDFAAGATSF